MNMKILQGVEKFFMEYLVKERGTSHHTIRSYRDTLVLFITYMQDKEHVKAENLSFYHINRKTVMGFLNWLQDERRSSASTRNQRYAAIRSFFQVHDLRGPKAYVTMERHLYHTAKKGF